MSTPEPASPKPPPPPCQHVVVVHGISDQVRGRTIEELAHLLTTQGDSWRHGEIRLDQTSVPTLTTKRDGHDRLRLYDAFWSDLSPSPQGVRATAWVLARQLVRLPILALEELDGEDKRPAERWALGFLRAWVVGSCILVPALLVGLLPALGVQFAGLTGIALAIGASVAVAAHLGTEWTWSTVALASSTVAGGALLVMSRMSGSYAVWLATLLLLGFTLTGSSLIVRGAISWLGRFGQGAWRGMPWVAPVLLLGCLVLAAGDAVEDFEEDHQAFAERQPGVRPRDLDTLDAPLPLTVEVKPSLQAAREWSASPWSWPRSPAPLLEAAGTMAMTAGEPLPAPMDVVLYRLSHFLWRFTETVLDYLWPTLPTCFLAAVFCLAWREGDRWKVVVPGIVVACVGVGVWFGTSGFGARDVVGSKLDGLAVGTVLGAAAIASLLVASRRVTAPRVLMAAGVPPMLGWCVVYLSLVFGALASPGNLPGWSIRYEVVPKPLPEQTDLKHYRAIATPTPAPKAGTPAPPLAATLLHGLCAKPRTPNSCTPKGQDPRTWGATPLGGTDLLTTILFAFAVVFFLLRPALAALPGILDDMRWTSRRPPEADEALLRAERHNHPRSVARVTVAVMALTVALHCADKASLWKALGATNPGDFAAYGTEAPAWFGLAATFIVGAVWAGAAWAGTSVDLLQDSVRWLDPGEAKARRRVVKRVQQVLRHALSEADGNVLVVAHSQGTMVSLLALVGDPSESKPGPAAAKKKNVADPVDALEAPLAERVALLTCGSPLYWIYGILVPRLSAPLQHAMAQEPLWREWVNVYFRRDYIGRDLWPQGGPKGCSDVPLEGPGGHTHYFRSERFGAAVQDALTRLNPEVVPRRRREASSNPRLQSSPSPKGSFT